ncbi:MAG: pyroglutamyl-peptidase [Chlamydiales bacterium]
MNRVDVLMTGFGAFEQVAENPSGRLACQLDGQALAHGRVVGALIPVSFERGPRELEALVERVQPALILATGVHPGAGFRLERGAQCGLTPGRPDADGVDAESLGERTAERMGTRFDLGPLETILAAAGPVETSDDAGGYVCECVYRRALEIGDRDRIPSLFLHLPSFEHLPLERQRAGILALLDALVSQASALAG